MNGDGCTAGSRRRGSNNVVKADKEISRNKNGLKPKAFEYMFFSLSSMLAGTFDMNFGIADLTESASCFIANSSIGMNLIKVQCLWRHVDRPGK